MIGVVKNDRIFEFRDVGELAYAIGNFAKMYEAETSICLITNTSDKLIGVIDETEFTVIPDISENIKYWIYMPKKSETFKLEKGTKIDTDGGGKLFPFFCVNYKIPKQIDAL